MAKGFLLKPLPIAALSANGTTGGTAAGFDVQNVNNDFAGVIWRSPLTDYCYIVADLGSDTPIDTLMAFGLWGNITFGAPYVQIALATQAQGNGFSGSNVNTGTGAGNFYLDPLTYPPLVGPPVSGKGTFLWQRPSTDISPTAVRYVLIAFHGLTLATDYIDIARLVIGQRFTPSINFNAIAPGVKDLGSLDFSARAVLMRRRAKKLRTISLTFSNIHKDELVASVRPLIEYMGNTEMVAIVTDPTADSDRMNRCYYGPHVGDLGIAWRKADCWETKLNIVSIF
jgi:hypothetical protein